MTVLPTGIVIVSGISPSVSIETSNEPGCCVVVCVVVVVVVVGVVVVVVVVVGVAVV